MSFKKQNQSKMISRRIIYNMFESSLMIVLFLWSAILHGPFPSIFVLFYFFLFIYWFKRYFLVVIRNFISLKSVSDSSLWAMELTNQLSIIISSFMVQFSFFNWFRIFWLSLLENQIFYFVYLFHCDQTVSKSFKYISAKSYVLGPLFDT